MRRRKAEVPEHEAGEFDRVFEMGLSELGDNEAYLKQADLSPLDWCTQRAIAARRASQRMDKWRRKPMAKSSRRKSRRTSPRTEIRVRGFYRLQIENPDGTIAGDSGLLPNLVTNNGFSQYLTDNIGKAAGSKQIGFVALGTGAAPIAADNTLAGEIMLSTQKKAVTFANVGSKTARYTATFASSDSFITGASSISNVGLFDTTTATATLFAGNTYTSSSLNTNQNVNVTYEIQFS